MSTADGTVVRTVQILNNGSPIYRYNIAILSEGYKTGELGQFANDASAFVKRLSQTSPFHLVMNSINIYRVEVSSTDSGADDPKTCGSGASLVNCGGSGATAKTYFDATFCSDGANRRLLSVNAATAQQVAAAQVPGYDLAIVVVNTAVYGGSGGSVPVYSLAANSVEIAIHKPARCLPEGSAPLKGRTISTAARIGPNSIARCARWPPVSAGSART